VGREVAPHPRDKSGVVNAFFFLLYKTGLADKTKDFRGRRKEIGTAERHLPQAALKKTC